MSNERKLWVMVIDREELKKATDTYLETLYRMVHWTPFQEVIASMPLSETELNEVGDYLVRGKVSFGTRVIELDERH